MSRYIYLAILIITLSFFFSGRADASDLPPLPGINDVNTPSSQYICKGASVHLDGSDSEDQDEDGESISVWEWDIWKINGGSLDYETTVSGKVTDKIFSRSGEYYVILWVQDDENTWNDEEDAEWIYVGVADFGIDKVVKEGTSDEGPLIEFSGTSVTLEAKPDPPRASFPSGEPHWTLVPSGSSAYLSSSTGPTTTLTGTDICDPDGTYTITATYSPCTGGEASIDVVYTSSSGLWADFAPAWSCGPPNQAFTFDDFDNTIAVYCDEGNHLGSHAYSWWYNHGSISPRQTEVGCCVWIGGNNAFEYKYTTIDGNKLFLKTKQQSSNDHKGFWDPFGEGCIDYWCFRRVEADVLCGGQNIMWRRGYIDPYPWTNPASCPVCPGTVGSHPGYPN